RRDGGAGVQTGVGFPPGCGRARSATAHGDVLGLPRQLRPLPPAARLPVRARHRRGGPAPPRRGAHSGRPPRPRPAGGVPEQDGHAITSVIVVPGAIGSGRLSGSYTSVRGSMPSSSNIVAARSSGRTGSLAGYAPVLSDAPNTKPRFTPPPASSAV